MRKLETLNWKQLFVERLCLFQGAARFSNEVYSKAVAFLQNTYEHSYRIR